MPQKQPPATTAVCSPLALASGTSTAGLGKPPAKVADELIANPLVVLQALIVIIKPIKAGRLKNRDNACLIMFVFTFRENIRKRILIGLVGHRQRNSAGCSAGCSAGSIVLWARYL